LKIILTLFSLWMLSIAAWGQAASLSHNSNLRSGPSTSSRRLALLPAGTAVTVISRYPRSGYVRVQTTEEETGWVLQRNVTPAETPEIAPANVPKQTPGTLVGDGRIYPNPQRTPGKADPTVTQNTIAKTICNKAWSTESVRPSSSVTDKIKVQTMQAYGFTDAANHYELDHLISLQNGGCPDCVENLWPEAYGDPQHPMTQNQRAAWNNKNPASTAVLAGSLEKDLVENHVHDEICLNVPNARMSSFYKKFPATVSISLQRAQQILATDWYACYQNIMDSNKPCE
jgi:uncharacterized protein YraI